LFEQFGVCVVEGGVGVVGCSFGLDDWIFVDVRDFDLFAVVGLLFVGFV